MTNATTRSRSRYLVGQAALSAAYFLALRNVSLQMLWVCDMAKAVDPVRAERLVKVTKRLYAACSVSCACLLAQVVKVTIQV